MSALADQEARDLIRTALDENLVVEAAAGTGKTTALVERIVAILAAGAAVDRIVAVTFTEKAAGELKLRMRAVLERARQARTPGTEARRHLEDALARLEEARVGTIHGLCADLLRERSVEAGVDPQFEIMPEPEAERVFGEAFMLWLQQTLEDPPEGVRRSLRRQPFGARGFALHTDSDRDQIGRLRRAAWDLASWRDFRAEWRREPFARAEAVEEVVQALDEFALLTRECAKPTKDLFYKDTAPARDLITDIRTAESVGERDLDGVEAQLVALLGNNNFVKPRKGYGRQYSAGVARETVHVAHAEMVGRLREFARDADADLAALLHNELQTVVERYEELKLRTGRVDFVDLLIRARNLVRDVSSVRHDFQQRFTHLFIDEFQDTDPLQAELLLLLASDDPDVDDWRQVSPAPGKLFLVADPKQSIYRFRRADVGTYLEVKKLLESRGARALHLTTSFRAVPSIQRAVNTAFARCMTGDQKSLQADYVPLTPWRDDWSQQPAVAVLPVPSPYGYRGSITKTAIESSLPDAAGAFVEWLLEESGWTVTERDDPERRVPVAARHVCLLFRRFSGSFSGDVTRGYVEALEARGIRHLLVGGRSFHEREEVETIRTVLSAVEWPDDELSVFATLRGSLFAIGDDALLEYRHRFGRLHPFRIPEHVPGRLQEIVDVLALLAALHRRRNDRPVAETINLLLETTRAHAAFVLRPSGEQALANVLHIAEQARAYESAGGISFRGFVQRLMEDAENGRAAEAPVLEEGSEGVRIMTVHKAKGLEFPVVILADMTAPAAMTRASRVIDASRGLCAQRIGGWSPLELLEQEKAELARDEAEGVRLAYVAATRARDLLVVPAVGDEMFGSGWVAPLNPAVYPPPAQWSQAEPAPGCPSFGRDSVFERSRNRAFDPVSVSPGLHRFGGAPRLRLVKPGDGVPSGDEPNGAGGHTVVWWDPAVLRLGAEPLFGIRQEELIGKDAPGAVVKRDVDRFNDWRATRDQTRTHASRPAMTVYTATEIAVEMAGDGPSDGEGESEMRPEIVRLPARSGRPAGPRFGALVHAVLATAPLAATDDVIRRVAVLQGRILASTGEEVGATCATVRAVLDHPLLERARQAAGRGVCRRETPLTLKRSDGALIDGVVDLAFLEDDRWTVVDFKTDRQLEKELAVYERQVALYATAIAAATGQEAVPILMSV